MFVYSMIHIEKVCRKLPIDMYCTNVLMYRMMVLLARPTKVRC
jgi:hypothetical protein